MKKLLLVTTAIAGVAFLSAPASAEVKLDLGGYFAGYGVWTDNNEVAAGNSLREFDLRRDTEVHVSGETTLDNGLTVGFHTEQALGGATTTDEAYAYFSGSWGRFNLGGEDGAAYLMQVAAPSADSNVDGLRTYFQAVSPEDNVFSTAGIFGLSATTTYDYDLVSDPTGAPNTDRISYMTPKFNGFQAGVSYAPETGMNAVGNAVAVPAQDDDSGAYENVWDAALRWDGEFQGFGISAGGGFGHASLELNPATAFTAVVGNRDLAPVVSDDLTQWNAGLGLTWGSFSLGGNFLREETENEDILDAANGGAYTEISLDVERDTWVVGGAWDNGPYHVGLSYMNREIEREASGVTADDGEVNAVAAEFERFTVGAGYTFGPGMTFRGAVAWGDFDRNAVADDATDGAGADGVTTATASNQDFTQVTIGTDIQF